MAATLDMIFTRKLLSLMHADVRKAFPKVRNVMRACTVTHSFRDNWFAEIAGDGLPRFYVDVSAFDAYDARYKAWSKFLAKYGPPEFHSEVIERSQHKGAAR